MGVYKWEFICNVYNTGVEDSAALHELPLLGRARQLGEGIVSPHLLGVLCSLSVLVLELMSWVTRGLSLLHGHISQVIDCPLAISFQSLYFLCLIWK